MLHLRIWLLALISMVLAGCAVAPPRTEPVVSPMKVEPEARVYTYKAPPPITVSAIPTTVADAEAPVVQPKKAPSQTSSAKKADPVTNRVPAKKPAKPAKTLAALRTSNPPKQAAGGTSAPVNALLKQSEAQQAAGNLVMAAATLERGLRIDSRNPQIWTRLARIRLKQGLYSQAIDMASKSSSMATSQPELVKENQSIIADANKNATKK